jgi:hypothetical protein
VGSNLTHGTKINIMLQKLLCKLGSHIWVVSYKKEWHDIVPSFVYLYPPTFPSIENVTQINKGIPTELTYKVQKCLFCKKEIKERIN